MTTITIFSGILYDLTIFSGRWQDLVIGGAMGAAYFVGIGLIALIVTRCWR